MRKPTVATMLLATLVFLLLTPWIVPAEEKPAPAAAPVTEANFLLLGVGYQAYDIEGGGETLLPYRHLDSHALGQFDALYFFDWPGKFDMSLGYQGDDYYDFQAGFNYKGSLDIKAFSTRFPRNFEHQPLPDTTSTTSMPTSDLNPGDRYLLDMQDSGASIRWRIPGYPAHLSLAGRTYTIEGLKQQNFVDWSCATQCHLVSRSRRIDVQTDEIEAGADAHVGWFDLSYTFHSLKFEDREPEFRWFFNALLYGNRPAAWFDQNVIPNIKAYDHYFNLSTTSTGRAAAIVGLAAGERTNEYGDLSQKYNAQTGTFVWRPMQRITWFFNFHRRRVGDGDFGDYASDLRDAGDLSTDFSSTECLYSTTVNYYPFKGLRFRGDLSLRDTHRENADQWEYPSETTTGTWRLSAQVKPSPELTIDTYFRGQSTDDPATTAAPNDRTDAQVAVNWQPLPQVLLQSSFLTSRSSNDSTITITALDAENKTNRREERNLLFGGLTFSLPQPVTVGLYFTLFRDDVTEDLLITGAELGTPPVTVLFPAPGSTYEATGRQITLQAGWKPVKPLDLKAELNWQKAEGRFVAEDAGVFSDIGSYTPFEASQKGLALTAGYDLGAGWGLLLHGAYLDYRDDASPSNNEMARSVSAMINKRW